MGEGGGDGGGGGGGRGGGGGIQVLDFQVFCNVEQMLLPAFPNSGPAKLFAQGCIARPGTEIKKIEIKQKA